LIILGALIKVESSALPFFVVVLVIFVLTLGIIPFMYFTKRKLDRMAKNQRKEKDDITNSESIQLEVLTKDKTDDNDK